MPVNSALVNTISSTVRILKDTVEYHWTTGCWPTAVGNVMGYWDRNGFDNLIEGDSSSFSEDVKNSLASPEHYKSYYTEYLDSNPDASSSSKLDAHENNSIADFLLGSRQGEGLADGWARNNMAGIGLHGYANYRGYDGFETNFLKWGQYTFENITDEIDAGRPLMLAIDIDGKGATDHAVVVYGYDSETQELIVHDGWSTTEDLRRIKFLPVANGTKWGIASATFVKPPASNTTTTTPNFLHLTDDGFGWAATYKGKLNTNSGQFTTKLQSSDGNLSRNTLGLASADGHTFYQLTDDGRGTARLGRALYDGSGKFRWKLLNSDSNLSRNTLGLATADGKRFYSLVNDGAGSAALYSAQLQNDATFTWQLLNKDSGLSRDTLALSTTNGKTFYSHRDDGTGTAASFELALQSNGTFDWKLLSIDSGISRQTTAQSAWVTKVVNSSPNQTGTTQTGTATNNRLNGTSYNDLLTGNAGNDELFGNGGNDTLIGGEGNDNVIAGGGDDLINATDDIGRGHFEQDYIDVGSGKDTVILGDETGSYYTADGWNDSVYIDNFEAGKDKLVLFGNADLYIAESSADGTSILYGQDYSTAIAYLNGVSSFALTDSTVSFVGEEIPTLPPEIPTLPPEIPTLPPEIPTLPPAQEIPTLPPEIPTLPPAQTLPPLILPTPLPPVVPTPVGEVTPEPVTPPAEPTTYNGITGTVGDDALLGTGGADRLVGLNGTDYAYGGGGADRFVLGNTSGSFYTQSEWGDHVFIDDFKAGTDQLELHGSVGDYSAVSDEQGTWLYAGGAGIDPIAYLNNVSNLQLSSLEYVQ